MVPGRVRRRPRGDARRPSGVRRRRRVRAGPGGIRGRLAPHGRPERAIAAARRAVRLAARRRRTDLVSGGRRDVARGRRRRRREGRRRPDPRVPGPDVRLVAVCRLPGEARRPRPPLRPALLRRLRLPGRGQECRPGERCRGSGARPRAPRRASRRPRRRVHGRHDRRRGRRAPSSAAGGDRRPLGRGEPERLPLVVERCRRRGRRAAPSRAEPLRGVAGRSLRAARRHAARLPPDGSHPKTADRRARGVRPRLAHRRPGRASARAVLNFIRTAGV